MFGIGLSEIFTALIFAMIIFGANRLPEVGRTLSEAIRESRKRDITDEVVEEGQ